MTDSLLSSVCRAASCASNKSSPSGSPTNVNEPLLRSLSAIFAAQSCEANLSSLAHSFPAVDEQSSPSTDFLPACPPLAAACGSAGKEVHAIPVEMIGSGEFPSATRRSDLASAKEPRCFLHFDSDEMAEGQSMPTAAISSALEPPTIPVSSSMGHVDPSSFTSVTEYLLSSSPFTNDEPLRWSVPPGVSEVLSFDFALYWSLTAGSQFTSVVSNATIVRGKYMYEVTLCTDGLLQIGWCGPMMLFPWTPRLGVGDFPFSIAFDGHRQRLWNVQATPCGHRWAAGDVITCCFDADSGLVSFYQNGELVGSKQMLTMGNAASPKMASGGAGDALCPNTTLRGSLIPHTETALCYSPALSLGQHETCVVNLGAAPFKFPVVGYNPVDTRGGHNLRLWQPRAVLLTDEALKSHRRTILLSLLAQLKEHTTAYWGYFCLVVYESLLHFAQVANFDAFHETLDTVEIFLSPEEYRTFACTTAAMTTFEAGTRRVEGRDPSSWSPTAQLLLLRECVTKHESFLEAWAVSSPMFPVDFLNLFRVKQPNAHDLSTILFPATGGGLGTSQARLAYQESLLPLLKATEHDAVEDYSLRSAAFHDNVLAIDDSRRHAILATLLRSPTGRVRVLSSISDCIAELRRLVAWNQQHPQAASRPRGSDVCIDNAVVSRIFFALVAYLTEEAKNATGTDEEGGAAEVIRLFCPEEVLRQPTMEGMDITRIGGSFAHVMKQLGGEQRPPPPCDPFVTLLTKAIVLYSAAVKDLVISGCSDFLLAHRQRELLKSIVQTPNFSQSQRDNLLNEMRQTSRSCAWTMSTMFLLRCHDTTSAFCNIIVKIMNGYSRLPEFALLPIVFVECFVDVWHYSRKTAPNYPYLVRKYPENVRFFVERLLHRSITHSETSEYLLLSLSGVIDTIEPHRQAVAEVLHSDGNAKELLQAFQRLTQQFQHPLGWTLAVSIFSKLNAGNYFCLVDLEEETIEWNTAYPGRALQQQHQDIETQRPRSWMAYHNFFANTFLPSLPTGKTFFKSLFTHANWSVSELGASFPNLGDRSAPQTQEILSQRRRCGAIFELSRKLLHILEFIVDCGRTTFFTVGGSCCKDVSELHHNVNAVLELWTQTLSRYCTEDNPFMTVLKVGYHGLEKMRQWKLAAPLMGILYNIVTIYGEDLRTNPFLSLLSQRPYSWSSAAAERLIFRFEWKEYNKGVPWDRCKAFYESTNGAPSPASRLLNALRAAESSCHLTHSKKMTLAEDDDGLVEDGICGICVMNPIDTVFMPCGHMSCTECINKQMQNSGKCFYCNTAVSGLRPKEIPSD